MSEKKKDSSDQNPNPRPKKKSPIKKTPFNPYWIYVVIAAVLIMQLLFSFSSGTKPVDFKTFSQTMLLEGDVDKLVLVRSENLVEIYVKKDALEKDQYKDVREKTFGQLSNLGPHYSMEIGTVQIFNE